MPENESTISEKDFAIYAKLYNAINVNYEILHKIIDDIELYKTDVDKIETNKDEILVDFNIMLDRLKFGLDYLDHLGYKYSEFSDIDEGSLDA